jgi:hypothetical protein
MCTTITTYFDLLLQHPYENTGYIALKHLKHLKHTFATYVFSATSTCFLDDWRLVNTELDVTEWRAALVEKVVGAVENAVVGRMARQRGRMAGGGARVWWRALRWLGHAAGARARRCGHDVGAVNGEEQIARADTVRASGYASEELGCCASVVAHQ